MTTKTESVPAILADALADIERNRVKCLSMEEDCRWVVGLLDRHPAVHGAATLFHGTMVYLAISCSPERLDDLAPLLRELRERTGYKIDVRKYPEDGKVCYQVGEWFVAAYLGKNCTFKQVGTKTVEQPVYEISCA